MTVVAMNVPQSLADRIRQHVRTAIIDPARTAGRTTVTVCASDIHADLGLENRMPAVCGALDARKFCEENGVREIRRSGPKFSSSVEWIFAL